MTFNMLLLWFSLSAHAEPVSESVVGHWQFYKKIFQEQEMPEGPEATLRLHFEFSADGVSRLYWWHEGERDHCSRKARYQFDGSFLSEEVFWVDPENTYGCDRDPDMQLGRRTKTPVTFRGGDLVLSFHLGDEPLYLVWKKLGGK